MHRAEIRMWTEGVEVEPDALTQLNQLSMMPFVKGIAVMPDCHVGIGCTVGTVAALKGAVPPAIVGVDIGCGMNAIRTSLTMEQIPDNPVKIFHAIEKTIPLGMNSHKNTHSYLDEAWNMLEEKFRHDVEPHVKEKSHPYYQIGTLGSGNHFIELCQDEESRVWLLLHSGSRNIGNRIGTYFTQYARKAMEHQAITLPNRDLAYLTEGSEEFNSYVKAVAWAQDYARLNRRTMVRLILDAIRPHLPPFTLDNEISCHHNYLSREIHGGEVVIVTRKGAVRAGKGEYGIIPGSMGARSFIVEGLGNASSYESCSHGAGRRMSRSRAKESITKEQHEADTSGVICRKDTGVLDESPSAYKSIDAVMAAQADLVKIKHVLKQFICVKG